MDCSPPGPSVHGIPQARILQWVAMPSSRGSSQPRGLNPRLLCPLHWQAGSLPLVPPVGETINLTICLWTNIWGRGTPKLTLTSSVHLPSHGILEGDFAPSSCGVQAGGQHGSWPGLSRSSSLQSCSLPAKGPQSHLSLKQVQARRSASPLLYSFCSPTCFPALCLLSIY